MSFAIVNASILDQPVDAIVNPANQFLNHAGGLARIIADAARGPAPKNPGMDERDWHSVERLTPTALAWDEEQRAQSLVPVGGAVKTSAGALPFKAVIHAVGPVWGGGSYHEYDLLLSAYTRAILLAIDAGYESVALPAIGMGIFGVPRDVVARASVNAARRFAHHIDITICLTSDEDVEFFEAYR